MPVSYVTIVPTWESLQLWRQKEKSFNWPMMSWGMGLAMLDGRISFDVNPSTEMSEQWLQRQKVIALCGASGLAESDVQRLAAWVRQGGGLLATYDSGLYDERGRLRHDGGALREVLGVEMKGEPLPSQPECYYRVKESHAALGEYGAGAIVEGDGRLVPVETRHGARTIAECWNLGTGELRGPAVVANNYGEGRTIYISGSLEANYLYDQVESSGRLFRSIVEYSGPSAATLPAQGAERSVWSTAAVDEWRSGSVVAGERGVQGRGCGVDASGICAGTQRASEHTDPRRATGKGGETNAR